jgi:quercetin dioxygenase-like cupin family protein
MSEPKIAMTEISNMADLIEIRPSSTISHTPLSEEGARVVLFGFDTSEELSEHTAAVPVLLQVLSGRLEITAAGRTGTLTPGGLIHLNARTPHSVVALEPTVLMLTLLDPRAKAA